MSGFSAQLHALGGVAMAILFNLSRYYRQKHALCTTNVLFVHASGKMLYP
jgi:hypothetical protein